MELKPTNGTPKPVTENVQLIDFLVQHMGSASAVAKALGYSNTSISNIYNGSTPSREGFTLMLRQLATDVMIQAAQDGALVKTETPEVKNDKKQIEEITRRVLAEISRAA